MSIKLIAKTHPFDASQRIVKDIDPATLRSIYEDLHIPLAITHARFMVNDLVISDPDFTPVDGDLVILNVVPGGGDTKQQAVSEKIVGATVATLGVILCFTPLAPLGVALIGSGLGMVAGGIVLYNMDFSVDSRDQVQSAINLRGSRNKTNTGGPVPLVLGTHRIAPHNGASTYTEISGDDQYLNQLFVVGSSRVVVDSASWHIGDTPLSGYKGVTITVKNDGSLLPTYPYIVKEITQNRLLAKLDSSGSPGDIIITTSTKTRQLIIDVAFNGLVKFNDKNEKQTQSVVVDVYYKNAGAADTEYKLVEVKTISAATTKSVRRTFVRTLDNETSAGSDYNELRQYDVRIRRLSDDSDKSEIIDKCYLGSVRSVQFDRPIKASVQAELCVAALKIKASDQLQGVIDELSCVAGSSVLDYTGVGSGPSAWIYRITSNPASLYLYVLTDPLINPRAKSYGSINWAELEAWHTFCDSKGYECNMIIDDDIDRDSLLIMIAQCGRATPVRVGGKYYTVIDKEKPAPMQIFTPRNSWDYSGSKDFPDYPHALKINFINRDLDYQQDQVIVYDDGYNLDGSVGKIVATKFQEITTKGVVTADHAWKEGRYKIAAARLRPETHEITVPAEYLVSTIGDRIIFSHDVILVGLAWTRIVFVTIEDMLITELRIDEEVLIEDGKTYALELRTRNGILTIPVTAPLGFVQDLILVSPLPDTTDIKVEDLASFGYSGLVTIDAIIMDISPQDDITARLTIVDYAPEIFSLIDDPFLAIPPHNPMISKPGSASGATVVTSVYVLDDELRSIKDLAISPPNTPTYYEIQTGYNVSGGTTIPSVPVIKISPGPQSVYITIDLQKNLTNYSHDELQVTDDPDGEWYSLRMDGTDWKGGVGGVTIAPSLFVVHANIPLVATTDYDTGVVTYSERHLWYRVRRRTKSDSQSAWCDPVAGIATPSDGSSIAEASIAASKLQSGVIEAAVAMIRETLTIDADLGFSAENKDGNERTQLNETSISFQRLVGTIWENIVRIGLNGLQSSSVHSPGALVLTNNVMFGPTGRRANGTDVGIPYPSVAAKVFHLDGDLLDQSAAPWWTTSGAIPSYDTVDVAIQATAPFSTEAGALAGGVKLSKSVGAVLHDPWWVDLWVRTTGLDEAYTIVTVGNAITNLEVRRVTAPSFLAQYNRTLAYADSGYFGPEVDVANFEALWTIDGVDSAQMLDIDESGWIHIAMGYDPISGTAYIVAAGYLISIPSWVGVSGSAIMDISLNQDFRGLKFDEIMVDPTVAINISAVFSRNQDRIPWASMDYMGNPFVIDVANTDSIAQNLIRSAWDGTKWICKFPEGTQLEWAGDGQPVYGRRWK